jgi:hypothetical protein
MSLTNTNPAIGDGGVRQVRSRKDTPALNSQTAEPNQAPLCAELIGNDTCSASGMTAKGHAPALALCRQLLAQGVDPDAALTVFRNGTLALRVRSIGEAANLEINSKGTGFVRIAPPARFRDKPEPLPIPAKLEDLGGW